jgi:thiol-disulfide isomerase/thioredoxin
MEAIIFYANWCIPCNSYKTVYSNLDTIIPVRAFDIENKKYANLVKTYNITSLPTTCIVKNDKLIEKVVGVLSLNELESLINKHN